MRLEDPNPEFTFAPEVDRRIRVPEPLPIRLVAVADMHIEAPAGIERELDSFYTALLGMQRTGDEKIVYRSENFDLVVDVLEPPIRRDDYRPVRAEINSLEAAVGRLTDAEIPYLRRKGIVPGEEALALQDPAGNWVELTESRAIG